MVREIIRPCGISGRHEKFATGIKMLISKVSYVGPRTLRGEPTKTLHPDFPVTKRKCSITLDPVDF